MKPKFILSGVGFLAIAAMLVACAGRPEKEWVELQIEDPGTGPTFSMTGTVHHLDLEGGLFVIRDDEGKQYQPLNLPQAFRVDGMPVEVEARRRTDVMTTGMAGATIELVRIRGRSSDAEPSDS
jgi:hypothetical protein